MTKQYKRFTKCIANEIANNSIGSIIDDVVSSCSDGRYCLSTEADKFEDNFVEDLQEKGFIVTEHRIDIIKECFTKQLEIIRNKTEASYYKLSDRYNKKEIK
jgi:hypothetical protein